MRVTVGSLYKGVQRADVHQGKQYAQTGSILIIDADSTIVELLIEILTDAGYVAYSAPPGEALAVIARHPPALVLLDVGCPGMRGVELLAQVRAAGLATMSIVVMTTAPRAVAPLLIPVSIECLAKPFELETLLACVARYVQPIAPEPALHALSIGQ